MKKKNALTFRQKQEAVEDLFKQYHRAKLKLYCLNNTNYYPQLNGSVIKESKSKYGGSSISSRLNRNIDDKDELINLIESFEIVIRALSNESQIIINHEFVVQQNPNWWTTFYSRSTYYRMKTRAMEEFLFYMNITY